MNIYIDGARIARLLSGLQTLGGIGMRLLDCGGRELCAGGAADPFCALVRACPEGAARCRDCAAGAARGRGDTAGVRFARCHAGAWVAVLPVCSGEAGQPLALLCAGPFLDAGASRERLWDSACERLNGFSGDADALRTAFLRLRACGSAERDALAAALEALSGCALGSGLILPAGEGDLQRLSRFLDEHYMEKLSLASISAQLHIGRTRLCALAKELSGGQTLFAIIARKRIDAAKELLIRTDRPVSAVAEAVGVSDYNYFSKIFRASVGVSPSKFRKQARGSLDDLV